MPHMPLGRTPADDAVPSGAEQEVVQLCSELIRIDSVNTGDPATIGDGGPPEGNGELLYAALIVSR